GACTTHLRETWRQQDRSPLSTLVPTLMVPAVAKLKPKADMATPTSRASSRGRPRCKPGAGCDDTTPLAPLPQHGVPLTPVSMPIVAITAWATAARQRRRDRRRRRVSAYSEPPSPSGGGGSCCACC